MDNWTHLVSGKPSGRDSIFLVDKDPATAAGDDGSVVSGGPDGEGGLLPVVDLGGEGVAAWSRVLGQEPAVDAVTSN